MGRRISSEVRKWSSANPPFFFLFLGFPLALLLVEGLRGSLHAGDLSE
ncbi:hypothetical protein [Methylacidimicrobium cyclopophantes]|nr:hypothetical protein [Methylacidimicrobium cyclopophantes]